MPANKRPYRLNYSVNRRGKLGGKKVEQAVKHYKTLQKREAVEWRTKWIENAFKFVLVKLKKYGINPNKI